MSGADEVASVGESAEEFTEKSRLRSLFAARDEAADAIREAPLREFEARHERVPSSVVEEHVRAAVTAYLLEVEPLLKNTETGREYWREYELSPIQLPESPPASIQTDSFGPDVRSWDVIGVPRSFVDREHRHIDMTGLKSYATLSSPIEVQWIGFGTEGCLARGENETVETTTVGVPRQLSETVFRAINKLLADLDIGLDAERVEDGEASYDYSDLL